MLVIVESKLIILNLEAYRQLTEYKYFDLALSDTKTHTHTKQFHSVVQTF